MRATGLVLMLLVLAALVAPCVAQDAQTPAAPAATAAVTAPTDPEDLAGDLPLLQVLARLDLDAGQLAKIIPIVQEVSQASHKVDDADAQALADNGALLNRIMLALVAGNQVSAADTGAYEQITAAAQQRHDELAGAVGNAVAQVQRVLTAQQAATIEGAAQQRDRLAMSQRMGGADNPADYVVMKLKEQVQLMPDEYLRLREQRALDMAQAILGGAGPQTVALAQQILRINDNVAQTTPEDFQKELPTLPQRVAQWLNAPDPTNPKQTRYNDFLAWLQDSRTPELLQMALAAADPTAAAPTAAEQGAGPADEELDLDHMIRHVGYVVALNQLTVTAPQLRRLVPLSTQLAGLVKQSDESNLAPVRGAMPLFTGIWRKLIVGDDLTDDEQQALTNLRRGERDVQEALWAQADLVLQGISQVLLPQQNAFIDWTNPHAPAVEGNATADQTEIGRDRRAMMAMTLQFFTTIRQLDQEQYLRMRIPLISDFLRPLYGMDNPQAAQAQQMMLDIVTQVKMMDNDTWQRQARRVASRLLDNLGLGEQNPATPDKPFHWDDMFQLFSDSDTPGLLQKMLTARQEATTTTTTPTPTTEPGTPTY